MDKSKDFSIDMTLREEIIARSVDAMALIDDIFFRAVMRDNPKAAEAIVRVALDMPDVCIESVSVQHEVSFPRRRGVRFDLKARRADGRLFDIEVQKDDKGDIGRRARFYLSALTIDSLDPKQGYEEVPDAYVLFVCREDPFKQGKAVYTFRLRGDFELRDGGQITFFNCAYKGGDAYGKLARDMTCSDFAEIADPVLKETVKSAKIGERRNELMIGITKEIYDTARSIGLEEGKTIGLEEGKVIGERQTLETTAVALLRDGSLTPERISELLSIPLPEVLRLKEREGV